MSRRDEVCMHREQALVAPQRSCRFHDVEAFVDDEGIVDEEPHKLGVGERDREICRRPASPSHRNLCDGNSACTDAYAFAEVSESARQSTNTSEGGRVPSSAASIAVGRRGLSRRRRRGLAAAILIPPTLAAALWPAACCLRRQRCGRRRCSRARRRRRRAWAQEACYVRKGIVHCKCVIDMAFFCRLASVLHAAS